MTLVAIVLIVVGAALSLFATSLIVRPTGWARATGTVVGLSSSAPSWAPHRGASFTYTSGDGTERRQPIRPKSRYLSRLVSVMLSAWPSSTIDTGYMPSSRAPLK